MGGNFMTCPAVTESRGPAHRSNGGERAAEACVLPPSQHLQRLKMRPLTVEGQSTPRHWCSTNLMHDA